MEIDGNVLAAKSLVHFGVQHMFGVVGIPVTSLANRAVSLGVRFIAFHNEQSAGYAASAYGYLTGRPASSSPSPALAASTASPASPTPPSTPGPPS